MPVLLETSSSAPTGRRSALTCARCRARPASLQTRGGSTGAACAICAEAGLVNRLKPSFDKCRGAELWASLSQDGSSELAKTSGTDDGERPRSPGRRARTQHGTIALAWDGGVEGRVLLRLACSELLHTSSGNIGSGVHREAALQDDREGANGVALPPSQVKRLSRKGTQRPQEIKHIVVIHVYDDSTPASSSHSRRQLIEAAVAEEGGKDAGLRLVCVPLSSVFSRGKVSGKVRCSAYPRGPRRLSQDHESLPDGSAADSQGSSSHAAEAALSHLRSALNPPDAPRAQAASCLSRIISLRKVFTERVLFRTTKEVGATCLLLSQSGTGCANALLGGIVHGGGYAVQIAGRDGWREGEYTSKQGLSMPSLSRQGIGTTDITSWWPTLSSCVPMILPCLADVLIVRPLREALLKEVIYYAHHQRLKYASAIFDDGAKSSGMASLRGDKSSIGRLTQAFISLLESNAPSTVSTINKTSSKLVFQPEQSGSSAALDPSADDIATDRSRWPTVIAGPSVPLPLKRAQQTASAVCGKEQNLGTAARRLLSAARDSPKWKSPAISHRTAKRSPGQGDAFEHADGLHAWSPSCPLCLLPASRQRHQWTDALRVHVPEAQLKQSLTDQAEETTIDLGRLLCYACAQILETPDPAPVFRGAPFLAEMESSSAVMYLPEYVLHEASKELQAERVHLQKLVHPDGNTMERLTARGEDDGTSDRLETIANSDIEDPEHLTSHPTRGKHTPRQITRDEMLGELKDYLVA
ncbi:hypothetical protein IE81DRAFT_322778 [Ceraceosorus guamensis]|uniref:Cytoplasmic tRNA 2-thiolation protein 2 n=1 Tax=Ceraceosorus guamensis TaxID=1522189 RepID=A0A316W5Y0_9BASI|nr:hypothetical protein IE81DRAFT_322778 [Ceraceosorus guamensis]PWN43065.1 hypothetical protein IE81DRAFT_322778 [Ceraceosorus guamensis]